MSFASDNWAGAHPEAIEAIAAANQGDAPAYGEDPWTAAAKERFREHFGRAAEAWPVFNGSAANVLCLRAVCRPGEAVICPTGAHLNVDECGAPEQIAGVKLLAIGAPDGKLTPELVEGGVDWERVGDEHASQPRVVSISNSTELGTVYRPEEVRELAELAHRRDLLLHVDGARIANAAAAMDIPMSEITTDAGVDLLSFGGTKNGLLLADAVVILREGLGDRFHFIRKQTLQLASKMRFISAQLEAVLSDDLWLRNATHANAMARRLGEAIDAIEGVELARPVEANGVFAVLPAAAIERLEFDSDGQRAFYVWDRPTSTVRLMCSWDTTEAEIEAFVKRLAQAAAQSHVT
jgi:threonine aldolase